MPQLQKPLQLAQLVSEYDSEPKCACGGGCDTIRTVLGNVMNTYHTSTTCIKVCAVPRLFLIKEQHTMVAKTVRKYIAPKYPVIDPFTVLYSPDEALVLPQLNAI